jgi:hypothetical protein
MLFTFSCSQVVDRQLFYDTIVAAAIEVARPIRVLFEMRQGPDHPVSVFLIEFGLSPAINRVYCMMMSRMFVFILSVAIVPGCTHIVFNVPQPAEGESLRAFPESFQAIYRADDETTDSLIVGATTVSFVQHTRHELPLSSVDTMLHITLKNGLLYDATLMLDQGVPYEIDDTLIRYEYYDRFTIGISDTLVLKQHGKDLVISSNLEEDDLDYWDVVLARVLKSGDLLVSTIGNLRPPGKDDHSRSYDADLEDFGTIAPYSQLKDDTFLFSPAPEQFKKLVKKKLFSEKQMYRRLN